MNSNWILGGSNNMTVNSGWSPATITTTGNIGCTGVSFFSVPTARTIFCDKPIHKMYRAIGSSCPCFKDEDTGQNGTHIALTDKDGGAIELRCAKDDLFVVEKDGLARSVLQLFEQIREFEITLIQMQGEINELRNEKQGS